MSFRILSLMAMLAALCWPVHRAEAGVVIMGTRVVYPAQARDVSLRLSNQGATPSLVQAWIDRGDANEPPETLDVPFMVAPVVARIDPEKSQVLRISYVGEPLPQDRESVFWLNVLEVPPKPTGEAAAQYLQFAVRSRIKIFFRPDLPGTAAEAYNQLSWRVDGDKLMVRNTSPYHVSFGEVRPAAEDGTALTPADASVLNGMVPPFGETSWELGGVSASVPIHKVIFKMVNDYGAFVQQEALLAAPSPGR